MQEILSLFENCVFDGELTNCDFEEKILKHLPSQFKYDYFYGMTKLVLVPKDKPFVIKIPFNGAYEWDAGFCEFENASSDTERYWDYCCAEVLTYRCAQANHVERFFCKTRYIGQADTHPIYIQQKATTTFMCRCEEDYSIERKTPAKVLRSKVHINVFSDDIWLTDALDYYGEKTILKLLSFIKDYEIDDLHNENVGYVEGKPKLIDYSNFLG